MSTKNMEEPQNPPKPRGRKPDANSLRGKCRKAGMPYMLVYLRIKTLGWTEEKALKTRKYPMGSPGHWKGKGLKAKAEKAGLNPSTVYNRIKNGWSEEEALSRPKNWWSAPV